MSERDDAREAMWANVAGSWAFDVGANFRTAFMCGFDAGAGWRAGQDRTAVREAAAAALGGQALVDRLREALETCVAALEGLPCELDSPVVGQRIYCLTHHHLAPCDEGMDRDAAIAQARAALG